MTYPLFIDDERFPPGDGREWEIARTFEDVAEVLSRRGAPSFMSFDHDLGDDIPTGFDIAKALVEGDMASRDDLPPRGPAFTFRFPEDFDFYVHSQNPVGKHNIQAYLDGYLTQLRKSA
jgi:hypothetical protein